MRKGVEGCYRAERLYPTFLAEADEPPPCTVQPDLFSAPPGEHAVSRARRENRAKAVCRTCPLRLPCRDFAVSTLQTGVWGVTNDQERRNVRTRGARRAA